MGLPYNADQARGGFGVNVGIYGSPMECLGYLFGWSNSLCPVFH